MKIKVDLPVRISVRDYHDFDNLKDAFRLLNPKS